METRFKGFGRALILVPVLLYLPLRAILGQFEESHHLLVVSVILAVSGLATLIIAGVLDGRTGVSLLSEHAWTSGLLESEHIFFYVPIRLVGVVAILASVVVLFL